MTLASLSMTTGASVRLWKYGGQRHPVPAGHVRGVQAGAELLIDGARQAQADTEYAGAAAPGFVE